LDQHRLALCPKLQLVIRKLFLPSIFLILAYGFWVSPEFREISAGVAILMFGMLAMEEGFRMFTGGVLEKLLRRACPVDANYWW